VDELIPCFKRAWAAPEVGVVAVTDAGDRAFCAGGDQKQREQTGDYGPSEIGLFDIWSLHRHSREVAGRPSAPMPRSRCRWTSR
jgi:1,4-dihydroxy-2-naphthoyl-CoA synthase